MKLGYARIFVNDLEVMSNFYRDVLELPTVWSDAENGHAGFNTGECTLILEVGHGNEGNRFTALSFTTPDIKARHELLVSRKVEFTQPPTKMDWGGTLAYFKDPEGNTLGLVGAMD